MANKNATQIEFRPAARGYVHVVITHPQLSERVVETLQYPIQGQLIGDPSIDEVNADALNDAATSLNEALMRLSSG